MSEMTETRVNGFLVLRRPELNLDIEARGAFTAVAPCLDGRCYGGVDRMPWFDVEEALYADKLPPDLRAIRDGIRARNADATGLALAELEEARSLLAYANRVSPANELVALRGTRLDQVKGIIRTSARVDWLGWDVVALGSWSLLSVVFVVPDAFPGFSHRINVSGLLNSDRDAALLMAAYREAEFREQVEELPKPGLGIDFIRIGRVAIP